MQIIVPMAGSGSRFLRAGYKTIKPLIKVDGMPIIEHVVRMFPGEEDFLFICNRKHLEETPLRSVLETLVPSAQIVAIETHKLGPVYTALEARDYIKDQEAVTLNYCDFSVWWDYHDFKTQMEILGCDGCITAYRGFHPHSLGPNLYAYMREQNNYMTEIQEKQAFTDQRMNEYASAGTYYFRSGSMLKNYFQRAIDRDLRVGGEFYASMPYNLLKKDDLDVYIYELEHFLQWGTPEDLEEYQIWSDHFASYADWRPALPTHHGANLIPMAGAGIRFRDEGYVQPKPLVPVAGVPMIGRALNTFPSAHNWIAMCSADHLDGPELTEALGGDNRQMQVVPVQKLTDGQAATCLLAREFLDPDAPLLIGPCDVAVAFNQQRYAAMTSSGEVDCLVWTFRNHPHANRNPKQYGWVDATAEGEIRGISCKVPLHEDVRQDPGIIGTFWFRKARFFLEAADALIAQNRRVRNEFYVDSAVEVLVEQGRRAWVFDVLSYASFGNPNDVRTFEYWETYFRKAIHHPYGSGDSQ